MGTTEAIDSIGRMIPALGQGVCSSIAISSTVSAYSGTVGPQTETVTLSPDVDCYVLLSNVSPAPTLSASNGEYFPGTTKYTRRVVPGVTTIQVLGKGGTTGLLNIVEDA